MVFLVNVILFSYCAVCFAKEDTTVVNKRNVFLSRKKRYLTFPPGSNFVIQFAAVKALLRIQPTGWNILEEVDYPFALPTDTRLFRKSNWINRNRRDIYSTIEQGLTSGGFNGTACVKKMICDARKYVPMKGKSMVRDILLAVFSYTGDEYKHEEMCNFSWDTYCSISIMDYVLHGLATNSF
ncbi:hypothetical protein JTB14_009165 [Gonioctena quinquepunctata]|nr:hypothetical protein JTB14_009165 [Gonioctena quinquepunctata]